MKNYLITQYQVVWQGGQRDTVRFQSPWVSLDLERTRKELKKKHAGCMGINLTYIECDE